MEIIKRNPKELIKADYNPRKISDKDFKQLKKSLETFQCVEPIVVNQFEGRENVIVGGHQRLKAMESLGWSEVPTVEVYLDLDEEKELNVRLNKNTGEFDFELLTDLFDTDKLEEIGFELGELGFSEIESELSEKSNELDLDDFDDTMKMTFVLSSEEYSFLSDKLRALNPSLEKALLSLVGYE